MLWPITTRETVLLNPQDIDLDDPTYLVPCFASLDFLARSIEAIGLINAPLVQKRADDAMIPVLGRRRLKAACLLGLDRVEARMAPDGMTECAGYRIALWENLSCRSLDRASAAMVVNRLLELFPLEIAAKEFFAHLGVPARGPAIQRLQKIAALNEPILGAFAEGRITEKTAVCLSRLTWEERSSLIDLASRLRLNANKAEEVIVSLCDLSILHGESALLWLSKEPAAAILSDEDLPKPEAAELFRRVVRSWRFPELVEKEQRFRERLDEIAPPVGVATIPSPAFEDERCTVRIDAKNLREVEEIMRKLAMNAR